MKSYSVILSPDPNAGGYAAIVLAMPGALTEAETREDAINSIADVMAGWLETAGEDGYETLVETPELVAREIASVLADRTAEGWDWAVEVVSVAPASLVAA